MKNEAREEENVLLCTAAGNDPVSGVLFAVKRGFVEQFLKHSQSSCRRVFDEFMENYSWLESRIIYEKAKRTGALLSEMPI